MFKKFTGKWYIGVDVCGSVHHSTVHTEKSNKMQQYIKIYYSILIWSSTCFGRHTAHHQEPKTALAASGFAYVEGCLDVWLLDTGQHLVGYFCVNILEYYCYMVSLHNLAFNPLNAELNPIWHLLALLEAHHILHISRIRVIAVICALLAQDWNFHMRQVLQSVSDSCFINLIQLHFSSFLEADTSYTRLYLF
jgi:hypothetical protein